MLMHPTFLDNCFDNMARPNYFNTHGMHVYSKSMNSTVIHLSERNIQQGFRIVRFCLLVDRGFFRCNGLNLSSPELPAACVTDALRISAYTYEFLHAEKLHTRYDCMRKHCVCEQQNRASHGRMPKLYFQNV